MASVATALQIAGVLFGLVMLYTTFVHYRRNAYTYRGATVWSAAWIGFIVLVLFPGLLSGVLDTFGIIRAMDFFVIAGMFFFGAITFYLFITVKRTEQRVRLLVERYSKREAERVKKK